MTESEHVLWRELRNRRTGANFYAVKLQLAVKVDGPIHDRSPLDDLARDAKLASLNVKVLRFTNDAVFNDLHRVVAEIRNAVAARTAAMPFHLSSRSYPAIAPSGRGGQGGAS